MLNPFLTSILSLYFLLITYFSLKAGIEKAESWLKLLHFE